VSVSIIDICNTALSRIGIRARIASLTEGSEEARQCSLHYQQRLSYVLGEHPWSFASKRKVLVLIAADPNIEWKYRYELPADCSKPSYIQGYGRNVPEEQWIRWQIEASEDSARRTILTDQVDAVLVYTSDTIPVGIYPAHFIDALEWSLAAEIATPLTASPEMARAATTAAMQSLAHGKASDSNEGQPDEAVETESIRARY